MPAPRQPNMAPGWAGLEDLRDQRDQEGQATADDVPRSIGSDDFRAGRDPT
jgi:hypothetical protein